MVNEDLDPCAPAPNTFTKIDFIYDYNMDYVDLFKEHVGSVYLYIFDQDSIFLRRQGLRRIQMDGEVDFSMVFDTLDFKPGNTYHLVAMANGNHAGYSATLETPGFVKTDLIEGVSKISDYVIKLDRDNDGNYDFGIVNYKDAFGQPQQMIDTIWSTKPDEVRTITIPKIDYTPSPVRQPDVVVRDTIPMMRLTNSIDVNIKGSYFNETMSEDDFHVIIDFPHGNGTIDFTGTVYPAQELVYQCLRKRMRNYNEATRADGDVWGVQSIFGVSRLQVNDESSLQMYDAKTGELIVKIDNFSDYLANAFSTSQADGQELLDRNYEFQVDLTIDNNGKPLYMDITIAILGWAKRIYFYDLM
ncbi:MAG: FimB/Mfa2 family fimbrial subunit [Muribaculaceae bacterium]|nr:FimB/Mfa2 family fimbrial subunit [Muribaculaceae bacterium]